MARGRNEARLLARLAGALDDGIEAEEEEEEAVAGAGLLLALPLVWRLLLFAVVWRYLQSLPKKQRPCDTQ